jgi:hypothetical protein
MSSTSSNNGAWQRGGGTKAGATKAAFEATFTCVNGKTMGRIIGTGGSGTKRITNTTRSRFPRSAPYLRGDRGTNTIALTARGNHGAEAVRFMAQMILDEQNWATGKTTVCPHPHRYVPVGDSKNVRHVIGQRGNGLRGVQNKAGKGVFIVHKPDHNAYLIEAMTDRDVTLAANYLNIRIQKIALEQTPRTTTVDIHPPGDDDSSGAVGASEAQNPWASLSSTSDDDDDDDDDETNFSSAATASQIRDTIGSINSNSSSHQNRHHQMARMAVADATGCHPSFVQDRQIQAYIRAQAAIAKTALRDMDHAKAVAQRDSDAESLSSSDLDQFPTLSSVTKPSQVTLKVTEIDSEPKQFDIKPQEGHFASALLPLTATTSVAAPTPPMPTGMSRQFSSAAPPMPTGMSRQFSSSAPTASSAPPPMPPSVPVISRSLTTRGDNLNEGLGEMPGSVSQFTAAKSTLADTPPTSPARDGNYLYTTPPTSRSWGDMIDSDDDDDDNDNDPPANRPDSRFNFTTAYDLDGPDMPPSGSC